MPALLIALLFLMAPAVLAQDGHCSRSVPEATLGAAAPFAIRSERLESGALRESLELTSGVSLLIENKGCGFYEVEYILAMDDAAGRAATVGEMIASLQRIVSFNRSAIDLATVLDVLSAEDEDDLFDRPIAYSENELGEHVTLSRERLAGATIYRVYVVIGL